MNIHYIQPLNDPIFYINVSNFLLFPRILLSKKQMGHSPNEIPFKQIILIQNWRHTVIDKRGVFYFAPFHGKLNLIFLIEAF